VVSPVTFTFDLTIPCEEVRGASRRAPAIYAYIERGDGTIRAVLAMLDTGAAMSVFDGEIARSALGFDPAQNPLDTVPLAGLAGRGQLGYVHEIHCYVGGHARFLDLRLHVAFTDPADPALPFNVLGRDGLNGDPVRGFFGQVQFAYRHHLLGRPPEVHLAGV
jgi:hypothetical protein